MPHDIAASNEQPVAKPVVAIGRHEPRLLTLTDTARYAVITALRDYDQRPAGCPDLAHRVVLRDALAAAGHPGDALDAVVRARAYLGLPNRGLQ